MNRRELLGLALLPLASNSQDGCNATGVVKNQETVDFGGKKFYTLTTPEGEVLITLDGVHPMALFLTGQSGQKVRMTLDPVRLEKIER